MPAVSSLAAMNRAARAAFGVSALRPSIESFANAYRSRRRSFSMVGSTGRAGAGGTSVRGGEEQAATTTSSSTALRPMYDSDGEGCAAEGGVNAYRLTCQGRRGNLGFPFASQASHLPIEWVHPEPRS